mmetsp:Transcript_37608/g.88460  ORF Transcript_37608/g.88460 Transcript_37608/m.88460 type:complete len:239 (-) Transcript_37608:58-774(-)
MCGRRDDTKAGGANERRQDLQNHHRRSHAFWIDGVGVAVTVLRLEDGRWDDAVRHYDHTGNHEDVHEGLDQANRPLDIQDADLVLVTAPNRPETRKHVVTASAVGRVPPFLQGRLVEKDADGVVVSKGQHDVLDQTSHDHGSEDTRDHISGVGQRRIHHGGKGHGADGQREKVDGSRQLQFQWTHRPLFQHLTADPVFPPCPNRDEAKGDRQRHRADEPKDDRPRPHFRKELEDRLCP